MHEKGIKKVREERDRKKEQYEKDGYKTMKKKLKKEMQRKKALFS